MKNGGRLRWSSCWCYSEAEKRGHTTVRGEEAKRAVSCVSIKRSSNSWFGRPLNSLFSKWTLKKIEHVWKFQQIAHFFLIDGEDTKSEKNTSKITFESLTFLVYSNWFFHCNTVLPLMRNMYHWKPKSRGLKRRENNRIRTSLTTFWLDNERSLPPFVFIFHLQDVADAWKRFLSLRIFSYFWHRKDVIKRFVFISLSVYAFTIYASFWGLQSTHNVTTFSNNSLIYFLNIKWVMGK